MNIPYFNLEFNLCGGCGDILHNGVMATALIKRASTITTRYVNIAWVMWWWWGIMILLLPY